jgi:molecular chaperone GrpE
MPSSRASDATGHARPPGADAPGAEPPEQQVPEQQVGEQHTGEQQAEQRPDLAADLARMEDRYKRALADLDNYRKRTARDLERMVSERADALLADWLDVVDTVDRALGQQPEGPLSEGLRAVLEQMDAILARRGVQRIGQPGERFDPERHEAIGTRETDEVPDMTVLDVARSGYQARDRVLRPAQVIVARRPAG